jgi:hypothetical protein
MQRVRRRELPVLTLRNGDLVLTLELGGPFRCEAEPAVADICNLLWPPAPREPQNPDPDLARGIQAAHVLGAIVEDTRGQML